MHCDDINSINARGANDVNEVNNVNDINNVNNGNDANDANDDLPATHDRIAHSTIVGVAPLLVVTSIESHSFSRSFWNHSAITTSIRWDAKIKRTGKKY